MPSIGGLGKGLGFNKNPMQLINLKTTETGIGDKAMPQNLLNKKTTEFEEG